MVEEVKNGLISMFTNYAKFSGRTGKREFWMTILGYFVINIVLSFVCGFIDGASNGSIGSLISGLWSLGTIIPLWALEVRRLHDTNKSGWYLLISLIPLVGVILLIIQYTKDSVNEGNNY